MKDPCTCGFFHDEKNMDCVRNSRARIKELEKFVQKMQDHFLEKERKESA